MTQKNNTTNILQVDHSKAVIICFMPYFVLPIRLLSPRLGQVEMISMLPVTVSNSHGNGIGMKKGTTVSSCQGNITQSLTLFITSYQLEAIIYVLMKMSYWT